MPMEKRVCAGCVGDPHLKTIIESEGQPFACDYCRREAVRTFEMQELGDRVDAVFSRFYRCTTTGEDAQWAEPSGSSLREVLEELEFSEVLLDDLVDVMEQMWCVHDAQEHYYGEDPHFVEEDKFDTPLSEEWRRMEESLKYEARLNNPTVQTLLERVFGPVVDDRIHGIEGVIVDINPGVEGGSFYRARAFESGQMLERAMKNPERNLGPAPRGQGGAGRMNAHGISVFYGSMDPTIAIAEIRPPVGSHVVQGRFDVSRSLRLLDLERLLKIDVPKGSPFDTSIYDALIRRDFLRVLARKLTRPVMPGASGQDYLITQAVSDFLATHDALNLDGVIFRSTQVSRSLQDSQDVRNVVLFHKSCHVDIPVEEGAFATQATQFDLFEFDEEGARIAPRLVTEKKEEKKQLFRFPPFDDSPRVSPALVLDRNSLVVSKITGVNFDRKDFPVAHEVTDAAERPKFKLNFPN